VTEEMFKKLWKKIKSKIEKAILKVITKKIFKDEKVLGILEKLKIVLQIPEAAKVVDKLLDVLEDKVKKTDTIIDDVLLKQLRALLEVEDDD
jgi:hypothetical protein